MSYFPNIGILMFSPFSFTSLRCVSIYVKCTGSIQKRIHSGPQICFHLEKTFARDGFFVCWSVSLFAFSVFFSLRNQNQEHNLVSLLGQMSNFSLLTHPHVYHIMYILQFLFSLMDCVRIIYIETCLIISGHMWSLNILFQFISWILITAVSDGPWYFLWDLIFGFVFVWCFFDPLGRQMSVFRICLLSLAMFLKYFGGSDVKYQVFVCFFYNISFNLFIFCSGKMSNFRTWICFYVWNILFLNAILNYTVYVRDTVDSRMDRFLHRDSTTIAVIVSICRTFLALTKIRLNAWTWTHVWTLVYENIYIYVYILFIYGTLNM